MNYNFGTGITNGIIGAGQGYIQGNVAGAIAGGIGGLSSGFLGSGSSSSAESLNKEDLFNQAMFNEAETLFNMNQQHQYNKDAMKTAQGYNVSNMNLQKKLQSQLNKEQFENNKWFIQNAYQNTVNDLRKAGLNPLLAVNNGANVGSVSGGSSSALSSSPLGTGLGSPSQSSPSDLLSAHAHSAQAKVAKSQLGINLANAISNAHVNMTQSAKNLQEAETESSKRNLNDSISALNALKSIYQDKENKSYETKLDSEIKYKAQLGQSALINAIVQESIAPSIIQSNRASAKAYGEQAGLYKEQATNLGRENKFNEEHPAIYGTGKTLQSVSPVVSTLLNVAGGLGTGLLIKGLAKGAVPALTKSVIMTPPSGFKYGN